MQWGIVSLRDRRITIKPPQVLLPFDGYRMWFLMCFKCHQIIWGLLPLKLWIEVQIIFFLIFFLSSFNQGGWQNEIYFLFWLILKCFFFLFGFGIKAINWKKKTYYYPKLTKRYFLCRFWEVLAPDLAVCRDAVFIWNGLIINGCNNTYSNRN